MDYKSTLLSLVSLVALSAAPLQCVPVDLGVHGETHDVQEINLWLAIKRGFVEEKSAIENSVKEGLARSLVAHSALPDSAQNKTHSKVDRFTAPYDIYGECGKVVVPAGTMVDAKPMPKGMEKSMCFVRFTDEDLFALTVEKFGLDCDYAVSDTNVIDLMNTKRFSGLNIFLYSENLAKRFNIEVLPTKMRLYENMLEYTTLSVPELKEELRRRRGQ